MRRPAWKGLLIAASILPGLSACGKKEETPSPDVASASASPVAEAPPKPQEPLPERTPGLWETTKSEEGSENLAETSRICTDASTEKKMGILKEDLAGDKCRYNTVSHLEDGSWGVLAQCDMGTGGINEISATIIGDYTKNYTMKVRAQTTGAALPHMNRVVNATLEARRLGPCKPEQRPGDIEISGENFNLYDLSGQDPEG